MRILLKERERQKRIRKKRRQWKSCWPFELNMDKAKYKYKEKSWALTNLLEQKKNCKNVEVFFKKTKGKTFEYDLAWDNHQSTWLFDYSMESINTADGAANNITDGEQ